MLNQGRPLKRHPLRFANLSAMWAGRLSSVLSVAAAGRLSSSEALTYEVEVEVEDQTHTIVTIHIPPPY